MSDIAKYISELIRQHRNDKWQKTLEEVNPKDNSVWKVANKFKKPYSHFPTLEQEQNYYITDTENGDIFGEFFQNTFTNNIQNSIQQQEIENEVNQLLHPGAGGPYSRSDTP